MAHRRRRHRPRTMVLVVIGAVILTIGGLPCYGYLRYVTVQRYRVRNGVLTVRAERVRGLGAILVTNRDFALYMFPPDDADKVTCRAPRVRVAAADRAARRACGRRHGRPEMRSPSARGAGRGQRRRVLVPHADVWARRRTGSLTGAARREAAVR